MEAGGVDFWLYHIRISLWSIAAPWVFGVLWLAGDLEHDLQRRNSLHTKIVDKAGRVLFHLLIGIELSSGFWNKLSLQNMNIAAIPGLVMIFGGYWAVRRWFLLWFCPLEHYKKGVLEAMDDFLSEEPEMETPDVETPIETVELP